ncbi:hypothetical protein PR048_002797 [Dryococelus australis]|uniref:Transposable element P transposase-like GTP-binding insertion domain-containing protein n=1 Tax=Dryococelus australis TaxID=614101 RepID=A0ABQ9IL78_9NEOP|nr:hypothetical protein PR048_002797 [Dryococelus australis]
MPSVADHVLVFMNSTKTHSLAAAINQVIRSVTATGPNVIATVYDQGANNQAAVNYLLEETRQLDEGDEELRMCPKLSDKHVIPENIRKMKVNKCAQVFSQRVSALMRKLAQDGKYEPELDKDAGDTADFLLLMDKLFDSVNGSSLEARDGKYLRCALKSKTMKFIDAQGKVSVPPSVKNWIRTLEGLKCIWKKLQQEG